MLNKLNIYAIMNLSVIKATSVKGDKTMTHAELLNYILKKEKLEKEDLAKLLGIRRKNIEKVFNGETELTKKQIKNISEFTELPEVVIKSGELTLPDLENIGATVINEEFYRSRNTERFGNFIKTRYKGTLAGVFALKALTYLALIFGFIFSLFTFAFAFIENIDISTGVIAFFTLVPFLLVFASIVPIFKITRKANTNEKGRFKIFYSLIIASLLISTIGTVIFDAFNWVFLIVGLIPVLLGVTGLMTEQQSAEKQKQIKILTTTLILVVIIALVIIIEFIEGMRESAYALVYLTQVFALLSAHICYYISKNFEKISSSFKMLSEKKLYKKRRVALSVISALLVTVIIAGSTHFSVLFVIKVALTNVIGTYEVASYSTYDKQNIVFTDEDETQTIENGDFTYEIPVEFIDKTNKDRQTETFTSLVHYNADETIMVASTYDSSEQESFSDIMSFDEDMFDSLPVEQDIMFEESLKIMFTKHGEITKNLLEKKYGFAPKTFYEYQKLESLLNPQEINYWNKQEAICHVTLLIMGAITSPAYYDKIYLCETEKEVGTLYYKEHINEETGVCSYQYHYSFDTPTSSWPNKTVVVRLPEELASTDLAYKIINSVEMK